MESSNIITVPFPQSSLVLLIKKKIKSGTVRGLLLAERLYCEKYVTDPNYLVLHLNWITVLATIKFTSRKVMSTKQPSKLTVGITSTR